MPKISLGRNCEVAYAIKNHGFKLESSLLNWAAVGSDRALFKAISNPLGVFSGQYTQVNPNMFQCETLHVAFHAKHKFENWKEIQADSPELLSAISELRSRQQYLALKLKTQLNGPEVVDAFLKPPRRMRSSVQVFCKDLRQLIDDNYPDNNVRLWIVVEGDGARVRCVDQLRDVFIGSVSQYTSDITSNVFACQASKDWLSLISFSEANV